MTQQQERATKRIQEIMESHGYDICEPVDLLADFAHWCKANDRDFGELCGLAQRHADAEENDE